MKVGILTFHCAHNYGAMLQAYGLQMFLQRSGFDVSIIDYRPDYLIRDYRIYSASYWLSRSLKGCLRKIRHEAILHRIRIKRHKQFNAFMASHFKLIPYSDSSIASLDAIVLGSDQIWNPRITGGHFDDVFFGKDVKCKIVSYAASMGNSILTEYQKTYYRKHLALLSAIGVRESSLCDLLADLTDKKITITLDPTLLAGVSVFKQMIGVPRKVSKYILVYEIESHIGTLEIAYDLARQLHCEVVELEAYLSFSRRRQKDQIASPLDFVNYIKNAECVVTTSFHGTAFSVMFEKAFYTVRQGNKADLRAGDFLDKIELSHRFIAMNERPQFSCIDYGKARNKLQTEVQRSAEFLLKALKEHE